MKVIENGKISSWSEALSFITLPDIYAKYDKMIKDGSMDDAALAAMLIHVKEVGIRELIQKFYDEQKPQPVEKVMIKYQTSEHFVCPAEKEVEKGYALVEADLAPAEVLEGAPYEFVCWKNGDEPAEVGFVVEADLTLVAEEKQIEPVVEEPVQEPEPENEEPAKEPEAEPEAEPENEEPDEAKAPAKSTKK